MKIYTIGYSGRTIEELKAITDSHNGGILDIRYSPRSRRPEWSKKRLTALYGNLYLHLWEWGNELYNQGEIQLADFTAMFPLSLRFMLHTLLFHSETYP